MSEAEVKTDLSADGPEAILSAWQELVSSGAHLHPPEIARMLNVSEAALVASRIGTGATRLRPDLARILAPVGEWGRVLCAFSTHCGVHMPLGQVESACDEAGQLTLTGDHMHAVVDPGAIAEAVLFIDRDDSHGNTRSLQFFDGQGIAVLKVFIFHRTAYAQASGHFDALTHSDQSHVSVSRETTPSAARAAPWSGAPVGDVEAALERALPADRPVQIQAEGQHAQVTWSGALKGVRFGRGMMHLHEPSVRSHLRLAPLTHGKTEHGLELGSEHRRTLRITHLEDRT